MEKELTGDKWTLSALKELSTDEFLTWGNKYCIVYDRDAYLELDKSANFEKDIWFNLGNCMWRKHQSVYQDHLE